MALTRKKVLAAFDRHAEFITGSERVRGEIRNMLETVESSELAIKEIIRHSLVWNLAPERREQLIALCQGKLQ